MAVRSILIVDDSAADRALYQSALAAGGAGYRFRAADSVGAARAELDRELPDCVLLDYLLPDGTGLDLVDSLVAEHGALPRPVVMLTGAGSEGVAVRAMKAGVADYAIKGSTPPEALRLSVEKALEKAQLLAELARRGAELEQLAYVVSHDLRAPLRSVHQNAELLGRVAGDALDDAARAHLERVLASTRRMERLIVELVGYCRIGGGAPSFAAVELGPLVEQVLADLESEVVESGAEVEVGPLPAVWGDPLRLRQLFQNLIGNALKFRREAEHRVAVEAERTPDGWRLCVRDNGPGIDPADTERIFGIFQRLPGAARAPGSGIGLSICRKIAEQHGSRVEVASEPGRGSAFSLVLADARPPEKGDGPAGYARPPVQDAGPGADGPEAGR